VPFLDARSEQPVEAGPATTTVAKVAAEIERIRVLIEINTMIGQKKGWRGLRF